MEDITSQLATTLAEGSILALLLAYLGGVLTSATPCVYPMIPITVGVIGGGEAQGKLKSFTNSLIYVAGLSFVYGSLGVFAALSGQMFGEISTNPWGYFFVANLCFLFAAWMMGWIKIPQFGLKYGLKNTTGNTKKRWWHLFMFGGAAGFVAGPCTAPVLAALLTYVATTGDAVFGGVLLFVFAFGLGSLLIIIGTFSGIAAALPKSGKWMIAVKVILALIMVATGEYFLIQMGILLF